MFLLVPDDLMGVCKGGCPMTLWVCIRVGWCLVGAVSGVGIAVDVSFMTFGLCESE